MLGRTTVRLLAGAGACAIAAACGASANDGFGASSGSGGAGPAASTGIFATVGAGGAGGLPPEQEVEDKYGAPVATGHDVWTANPSSGRVAYIDATTFEIKLVDAGNGPTYLAPIPDPTDDVAIVLNVLSYDATVLRTAPGKDIQAITLPVPSNGNAWAISKDGRFAIAWTDAKHVDNVDPIEGYQDIAVLDLAKGKEASFPLTVGYRPVALAFDAASQRAYAITQDGISVVDLFAAGGPAVVKNIKLNDGPSQVSGYQVVITPDGSYALTVGVGIPAVRVVSLSDGSFVDVTLPAVPTDLDLMPDGTMAVAVIRDTSQVALLPIPAIASDPATFTMVTAPALIGSVSLAPKSPVGFFYTNAVPSPLLTVIDTSKAVPEPTSVLLRAPILAVFPTPDASNAIALHDALDTQGSHFAAAISVAPIALDLPAKIVGLDAKPIAFAVTGERALIASGDEATGIFQLTIASMPSLKIDKYPLASLPIAAGIVEGAKRGYVAQKHPDGRITFIDLVTGQARTITGFELSTQVVDGTKP